MNNYYQHIAKEFKAYFEQYEQINFALLFGSCVTDKFSDMSDIDVAIHSDELLDILLLGKMISDLEKVSNRKIDIIELNDLYKKNPLLAYNIISGSDICLIKNPEKFVDFKKYTYLYYIDTAGMRLQFRKSFLNRIEKKKFGKRNYA
jgi:predicted nucleotidyltransferase